MADNQKDSSWCIDLRHVTKRYGRKVLALDGISMQVAPGEIFGLLGPNGAGKSTLVKIMMTVVRPTRAEGTMLGHTVGHKPTLKRVGYLPEHHRFPSYLTGRQVLEHYGALSGVPRRQRKKRAGELLDIVGMTSWAKTPVSKYSKGMAQRVGLAQALVNDPELVVLDEPTDGVDPIGRREIRDVLRRVREEGRTVFLNSHLLSEIEMVCTRVAILNKGHVVRQGTIAELTRDTFRYEVEVEGDATAHVDEWSKRFELEIDATQSADLTSTVLSVETRKADVVQPLIDVARSAGLVIRRVEQKGESLEDLFISTVEDAEGGSSVGAPTKPPSSDVIMLGETS